MDIECRAEGVQALTVLWYRQFPRQGLTLVATSNQGSKAKYEQGFSEAEFPIHHPNVTFCSLTVAKARPADSSLYLCAAGDTARGWDQRPRQEPLPPPLFPSPPRTRGTHGRGQGEGTPAPLPETAVWGGGAGGRGGRLRQSVGTLWLWQQQHTNALSLKEAT